MSPSSRPVPAHSIILSSRVRVRAKSSLYVFHILRPDTPSALSRRVARARRVPHELVDILLLYVHDLLQARFVALHDVYWVADCTHDSL